MVVISDEVKEVEPPSPAPEGDNPPPQSEGEAPPSQAEGESAPSQTEGESAPTQSEGGEEVSVTEGETEGEGAPSQTEDESAPIQTEGEEGFVTESETLGEAPLAEEIEVGDHVKEEEKGKKGKKEKKGKKGKKKGGEDKLAEEGDEGVAIEEGEGEEGDEKKEKKEKKGKKDKKEKKGDKKKGKKSTQDLTEGTESEVKVSEGGDSKPSKSQIKFDESMSKSGVDVKRRGRSFTSDSRMGVRSSLYAYSDSLYSMASSSSTVDEEPEKPPKEKDKKGKDKKGKKGKEAKEGEEKKPKKEKKEKKEKKKKEAKEEDDDDDVMAAILAMKQTAGEVPVEAEEQPTKKKKMSKKEKARLHAQKEEEARIAAEQAEQAAQLAAQQREEYLKVTCKAKENKDIIEQAQRVDQLTASAAWIKSMKYCIWNIKNKEKANHDWEKYLKCDGLPDPADPAQMNTYLHLWEKVTIDETTPEECVRRTREVLGLLDDLNDYIDDPFNVKASIIEDWYWVRELCREAQRENLDVTTYRLIRDIEGRLNRIDIPTADFQIIDDNFIMCLWLFVEMAPAMFNPKAPQKPKLFVKFPEMNTTILFPGIIDGINVCVRGIYVKYDHLTDTCASFNPPPIPQEHEIELLEAITKEWFIRMMYKWDNRKRKHIMLENAYGELVEGPLEPEPELEEGELPPQTPFVVLDPTPSEHAIAIEEDTYAQVRTNMCQQVPPDSPVINLRKFLIVGGIFYVTLAYQPPYPRDKVLFEIRLTRLLLPKRLAEVDFKADYHPPEPELEEEEEEDPECPIPEKTPEEIEEERILMEQLQQAELEKLLLITIKVPEHVIFLDLPTLCTWDPDNKQWTTDEIYDVKQIEEQNLVIFRTTRFGAFSFAINRYINMPFQAWDLKPEPDGSVTFQLTCAILMLEFNVKKTMICLTQLLNSPNEALKDIIGTYYKLPKLIRVLREGGIDIFPAYDAFCYLESGFCEKHWPLEKNLYQLMGLMSSVFNFSWSRWNVQAPRRNIIMQMREYHHGRPKQGDFHMLLVTPLKSVFVNCTEISQEFTDEPIQGINKFCSDLFHLMKASSGMGTKNKVAKTHFDISKTVGDLLIATRIHSFS